MRRCQVSLASRAYGYLLTPVADFAALREETMQKNEQLQKSAEPVLKVIENPEVVDRLKGAVDKQRNMELLQKEYNVCSCGKVATAADTSRS
jgi:hypothetical protein